jgi:YVTN family beta-propeller protein
MEMERSPPPRPVLMIISERIQTALFLVRDFAYHVAPLKTSMATRFRILQYLDAPAGVAFNPTNNDMYVANTGSNTVSVIDSSNTVVGTISVGNRPEEIAFCRSNNDMYVTNFRTLNMLIKESR